MPPPDTGPIHLLPGADTGSLTAWWESALWLAIAGQATLLFGLRRQRTDDVRGAYRWWLIVVVVAVVSSVIAATHVHAAVATQLAGATGFSPLPRDAFWWLAPGVVALAAVAARCVVEVRESRLATVVGGLAVAVALGGWCVAASLTPAALLGLAPWLGSPLFAPVASIAAASLALMSLLLYTRRVVLEMAGAVPPPATKRAPAEPAKLHAREVEDDDETAAPQEATRDTRPRLAQQRDADDEDRTQHAAKPKQRKRESAEPQWVSGGEPYADAYEDDAPQRRRLSKAERKRLRREKARRAA